MPKKRIQLEIKPCCSNCDLRECLKSPLGSCRQTETNPCNYWKPDRDWFKQKLKTVEKKQDKQKEQEQK